MQFPYRVIVKFSKDLPKIDTIKRINDFTLHSLTGKFVKYNILNGGVFIGIEVGFTNTTDAIHFRLGLPSNGQEIVSKNFSIGTSGKEEV